MKVKTIKDVNKTMIDGDESCHPELSPLKEYVVIEVSDEEYRIIADDGEPYVYSKKLFTMIDETIPTNWKREDFTNCDDLEEGEYYLSPQSLKVVFLRNILMMTPKQSLHLRNT